MNNRASVRKQTNNTTRTTQTAIDIHQQTLPDAIELERYEKIHPGVTNRIVTMAEKEQDDRHLNNKRHHDSTIVRQISALISTFVMVGLCVYGFHLGFGTQVATIATSVIAVLAIAYLQKRN